LKLSHKGNDQTFSWGAAEPAAIKWAAFYSDCEHEVLEVKSGHRVTLTYNLFVSEQIGGVLQAFPTVDPTSFPLFDKSKRMLGEPCFMPEGGVLGFCCEHQYAHTRKIADEMMP